MTWRNGLFSLAAASMMAGTALTPVEPVQAQIPAFLPNKDAVPQTQAMAIDGDWRVNTINKVIRIERGRAYAVEGWLHAFVLRVQPDMVTIRNIQQINDAEYVGDDLPMMGRVTMKLVAPDRIEASVPGMFGSSSLHSDPCFCRWLWRANRFTRAFATANVHLARSSG